MYELIGYRRGTSDKCGDYIMMSFICNLTARDTKGGFVGRKVVELFMTAEDEFYNYIQPEHVGKKFNVMLGLDREVLALEVLEAAK